MAAPEVRKPAGGPAIAENPSSTDGSIVGQADAERKAWAKLQAEAALAGCELHRMDDGAFLLSRWGLSRELPSIAEVRELLHRIGGCGMNSKRTATVAQLQARAKAWLQAEVERSRNAMGPAWPQHALWVIEYLRAELAERSARWRA